MPPFEGSGGHMDTTHRILIVLLVFFGALAIGESSKRASAELKLAENKAALMAFRHQLQAVERRIDRAMTRAAKERARLRPDPGPEGVGPVPILVFDRIHEARPGVACTTPITAAFAAFDAFGARNIAVLTPYRDDVNQRVRAYIEGAGYRVPVFGSFNEEDDNVASRIDQESIRSAAADLGAVDGVEAVFVSCTSIRLGAVARAVEEEIGKPVTSSNHAMAWHCLRLAGVDDPQPEFGSLFSMPLPG